MVGQRSIFLGEIRKFTALKRSRFTMQIEEEMLQKETWQILLVHNCAYIYICMIMYVCMQMHIYKSYNYNVSNNTIGYMYKIVSVYVFVWNTQTQHYDMYRLAAGNRRWVLTLRNSIRTCVFPCCPKRSQDQCWHPVLSLSIQFTQYIIW